VHERKLLNQSATATSYETSSTDAPKQRQDWRHIVPKVHPAAAASHVTPLPPSLIDVANRVKSDVAPDQANRVPCFSVTFACFLLISF
jgi:hypothetical protein